MKRMQKNRLKNSCIQKCPGFYFTATTKEKGKTTTEKFGGNKMEKRCSL